MPHNLTERQGASEVAEKEQMPLSNYLSGNQFDLVRIDDTFALLRAQALDGTAALVRVANDYLPSSTAAKRLKHEYDFSGQLQREWAIPAIAYTSYQGRPALVHGDCDDLEPLDILIVERGSLPLDLKSSIHLCCELVGAVRKMHEQGVIHQDINPSNVFVGRKTGVRLAGFGFASRSPSRTQPNTMLGTYAYMSPEQTGRMNRPTDNRSDLYSLGVTLFQLLTGSLPFEASNPTEWAHSHLAQKPPLPSERVANIPTALDTIVSKLLAKDPDQRYQTARGLESDLKTCLAMLTTTGSIEPFAIANNDILDRVSLPKQLYGRSTALDALIEIGSRVTQEGTSEVVFVAGSAGVGKSSLVKAVHGPLRSRQIFFATGKFDQFKRDIPYSTFAQAFRELVRQLLTKSDKELAHWKRELLMALGPSAQLMVGLIPELVHIIGEQPTAPMVDLQSTQARFHLVFRSLLRVFAKAEHPLLLFLDDLQWLDSASIELLERIAADPELNHLLIVGAYRDDEVGHSHPLVNTVAALRNSGRPVSIIELGPIDKDDLALLVGDTLGTSDENVNALAELIQEKTAGNPFFAVQFISEIASEKLLRFNPDSLRWTFDLDAIRRKSISRNVAHLIARKLERLPPPVQEVLCDLALLGSAVDLHTLSSVHGQDPSTTLSRLRLSEDEGLIRHDESDSFSFIHDHIQEAAYALIPSAELAGRHLTAAKQLVLLTPEDQLERHIFDIVSQLDRALSVVSSSLDRNRFARLYLIAGRQAKTSGAFSSAASYFSNGQQLLGNDGWSAAHRTMFELGLNSAECEIVAGDFAAAERRLNALERSTTLLTDLAQVACLAILLHFTTGRSQRAVEVGLTFLARTEIVLSSAPEEGEVRREYESMHRWLAMRPLDSLLDLPTMEDPTVLAVMAVLTELFPAAYATDRHLMEMVLLRMINLSLDYGHCASSSVAYSAVNMATGSIFRDYHTAFSLGRLAIELVDRRESDRYKARVYSCFAAFAMPWMTHVSQTRSLTMQAFQISSSMGDKAFAAYNLRNHITHVFMSGAPLAQVQQEAERAIAFARDIQLGLSATQFFCQLSVVRCLRAMAIGEEDTNDDWAIQNIDGPPGLAMMACYHWVFRLQEHFFTGNYRLATRAVDHLEGALWAMRSSVEEAEYTFFASLAKAACYEEGSASDKRKCIEFLCEQSARLNVWTEHGPRNFACRKALVDAELAKLQGRRLEAQILYEDSIRLARADNFIQIEAVASELASRFYGEISLTTVSEAYLRHSYTCYERWGCVIKLRQLERLHPHVLGKRSLEAASEIPISNVDAQVVGQASKTLSSETDLSTLIETLMRLAVQHAGADRGLLLLATQEAFAVKATAVVEKAYIDVRLFDQTPVSVEVPNGIINYVARTMAPLILDDSISTEMEYTDEYLRAHCPRSVLCLPILKSTRVIGVLYLENLLVARAFAPDRVAVLDFLASQAAIWLENARLYSDLRRSEAWLREAQHLSRTGSFFWEVESDKLELSDEMYRICRIFSGECVTMEQFQARVHPEDVVPFREMVASARQSPLPLVQRFRMEMADKSVTYFYLAAHGSRTQAGALRYLGAVQDVTEQHLSQEALSNARTELARVARQTTLGVLVGSIAHQVHQPLLGIVANATTCIRMLSATPPNIEGARGTAQRSIRDGYRAADMIRRLQSLFVEGGGPSELIDINDAAREVISLLAIELTRNQVSVKTRFSQLPLVAANRVQLQQAIMNLVLNAAEAMSESHGSPRRMILSTHADNDVVQVDVKDCGAGFSEEATGHLFEPFYTTKMGGMGMGLTISRSIIESHGGRAWAALNSDGPGSTFSFSLPIGMPHHTPEASKYIPSVRAER